MAHQISQLPHFVVRPDLILPVVDLTIGSSGSGYATIADILAQAGIVYNVKTYGALGNGIGDDAPAVQKAVLAAYAAGGGTVYFPNGTYSWLSYQGAYNIMVRPRSGVSFVGESATTVKIKAGPGLNNNGFGDGFSMIRHVVADENIARCDNVTVTRIEFDHNGTNNLLYSGHANKPNIAVGAEVGKNISVTGCVFSNNAGEQTLSFGNNTFVNGIQSIEQLNISGNTFREMGGSVAGNVNSTDHSSIYAQGRGVIIANNMFLNATFSLLNTAIECHSSNAVITGNVAKSYGRMFNIVATVTDQKHTIYSHNSGSDLGMGAVFWQQNNYNLDDVEFCNNTLEQTTSAVTQGFIDLASDIVQKSGQIVVAGNLLSSLQATGTATTASGIDLGAHTSITVRANRIHGFAGRGINQPGNPYAGGVVRIVDNHITDCGTTSNASYKAGIALLGAVNLAYLAIERNHIENIAAAYMTTGISGNMPVTAGNITDNNCINVATEISWTAATTPIVISHSGNGSPITLAIVAAPGSRWFRKDGSTGTTFFVKETGNAGAGWIAK